MAKKTPSEKQAENLQERREQAEQHYIETFGEIDKAAEENPSVQQSGIDEIRQFKEKHMVIINGITSTSYVEGVQPFKTQYNKHKYLKDFEKNNGISETIPDQSLSIPEIIKRHARGLPITGGRTPIYEGEDDLLQGRDWQKLDLSEKAALATTLAEEFADIQTGFENRRRDLEKEKQEKEIQKRIQEELKKQKDQDKPDNVK